ncbi:MULTISPECIES: Fur family transcriptional regulator [Protofrankia]|uniref:Ferric uptake regulator, Fur family n=1 Tax=Candidatus Protofrankia datiscae TaxID=2716812 RepID=F8AW20_9ACTN|nr:MULTISPECIES: transcriptional repressor [Protofrankia]AEH11342.1 ferric uptake regulator, Fur family [Candidatus Protofrankia datiscae]
MAVDVAGGRESRQRRDAAPGTAPVSAVPPKAQAPGSPAAGPAGDDAWQTQLRSRGYRLTPQRQLVLEAVTRLGHATPEEIVTEVRRTAGGVNISTVYRTLDLLEELDLVSHAHLSHGAPTYHAAGLAEHVHLVCGGCGAVQEIPSNVLADLVTRLRDDFDFSVDVSHVALAGRCGDCAGSGSG